MSTGTDYMTVDRFRPKDQDIIRAMADLMASDDYPLLGLQRQGRRGCELEPIDQSVKMRLVTAGLIGDTSGRRRWSPSAFTEKDVGNFFRYRLAESK